MSLSKLFRCSKLAVGALVISALAPTFAHAQPLSRDLSTYCIFAQRHLGLKNIKIDSACNIGVNCAQPNPNSSCGVILLDGAITVQDVQIAGDDVNFTKPGASVWQVFTNHPVNASNVTVNNPPIQTFTTPLIPGTCGNTCNPDPSAVNAFCAIPNPFPDCDPTKNVVALQNSDCLPYDTNLGNKVCDLPPGTYGRVNVQNDATMQMAPGDYNVCEMIVGKQSTVLGTAVVINVADAGKFNVNNDSTFGQGCGNFKVRIEGPGSAAFGRNVVLSAEVCAPEGQLSLGHGNTLTGYFFGETVNADRNNHVKFCGCQPVCVP